MSILTFYSRNSLTLTGRLWNTYDWYLWKWMNLRILHRNSLNMMVFQDIWLIMEFVLVLVQISLLVRVESRLDWSALIITTTIDNISGNILFDWFVSTPLICWLEHHFLIFLFQRWLLPRLHLIFRTNSVNKICTSEHNNICSLFPLTCPRKHLLVLHFFTDDNNFYCCMLQTGKSLFAEYIDHWKTKVRQIKYYS